jgi:tetratricopeptide (TPR) repeat protein
VAHFGNGESRLAQAALAKSLELEGGNVRAHMLLAEIAAQNSDYVQARKEIEAALKLDPGNYQARMMLGTTYLSQQKLAEAQAVFEGLVQAEPNNPAGYYRLGMVHQLRQQYEPALQNYEKALAINPNLLDVFGNIIQVLAEQKQFEKAFARCDRQMKQVEASPAGVAVVYNLKGNLHLARGDLRAAEAAFQKATQTYSNLIQPYYGLAGLYLRNQKADKAIEQFQSLLNVDPKQAAPHMMIGIICDSQNQPELSEKHYRAALEIDPLFAPAANNLAYILADSNRDLNDALKFARLAKEKLPDSPNVMDTLGWVYYRKGLYDSAISELKGSLAKVPDNPTVVYHLGMAYYKRGEKQAAKAELERVLTLSDAFPHAEEAKRALAEMK